MSTLPNEQYDDAYNAWLIETAEPDVEHSHDQFIAAWDAGWRPQS